MSGQKLVRWGLFYTPAGPGGGIDRLFGRALAVERHPRSTPPSGRLSGTVEGPARPLSDDMPITMFLLYLMLGSIVFIPFCQVMTFFRTSVSSRNVFTCFIIGASVLAVFRERRSSRRHILSGL